MYFKKIKMKNHELFSDRARGFTLIEVIIGLVLVAILGTMLVTFMGTSLTESAQIINRVDKTYKLDAVMENITTDYKKLIATDSTPLSTIKNNIGVVGSTYNNTYGSYNVIYNGYIVITCSGKSCGEGTGGSSLLKVTIADTGNAQTITALFAQ